MRSTLLTLLFLIACDETEKADGTDTEETEETEETAEDDTEEVDEDEDEDEEDEDDDNNSGGGNNGGGSDYEDDRPDPGEYRFELDEVHSNSCPFDFEDDVFYYELSWYSAGIQLENDDGNGIILDRDGSDYSYADSYLSEVSDPCYYRTTYEQVLSVESSTAFSFNEVVAYTLEGDCSDYEEHLVGYPCSYDVTWTATQ